jgi:hypothetical protein
MVNKNSNRLVC